jgi:hypothetical protein
METNINEIEINGVVYVPKYSVANFAESVDGMPYQIVRTYSAGVFAGYVKSRNGQEVQMVKTRRLWYWKGANCLSDLAINGTKCPSECKFSVEATHLLINAIEILDVTDTAKKTIDKVSIWQN